MKPLLSSILGILSIAALMASLLAAVPHTAMAAAWLAPAASDRLSADWVKDIEEDLRSERFRQVFMNMSGGSPHSSMLHYFNAAAQALDKGQTAYAADMIAAALHVLDNGIQKGWYSRADIDPLMATIRTKALAALDGKATPGRIAPERWTGYTQNRRLGLTERLDLNDDASRVKDEHAYEKPGR